MVDTQHFIGRAYCIRSTLANFLFALPVVCLASTLYIHWLFVVIGEFADGSLGVFNVACLRGFLRKMDMQNKFYALMGGLSLLLLACSFLGLEEKDNPVSSNQGLLVGYSFGRGGDFSVILKSEGVLYKKFYFYQFRSELSGKLASHKGRLVRIDHYDRLIANCWEDDRQFCFSKCESDGKCRLAQNKSGALWLRSLSAVLAIAIIMAVLLRHMRGRN